jgi:hypothetical protein
VNDLLTFEEVAADLGVDQARRLARHTNLRSWDGMPCWEIERLADLLALLAGEDLQG